MITTTTIKIKLYMYEDYTVFIVQNILFVVIILLGRGTNSVLAKILFVTIFVSLVVSMIILKTRRNKVNSTRMALKKPQPTE